MRFRALNFGYKTKYRILVVGTCLIVYKRQKDKYQKWAFRAVLKEKGTGKYYEFVRITVENADIRLFDISNGIDKNFELIIYDGKIESKIEFKIVKHYDKIWLFIENNNRSE